MKKFLAALLALIMMFTFVACDSDEKPSSGKKNKKSKEETTVDVSADENKVESVKFYDSSSFRQLATVGRNSYKYYNYDTEMYGIISVDGTKDTGFIYYECSEIVYGDGYRQARTKEIDASTDFDSINSVALVDWNADTLLEGFCEYRILNETFFVAARVVAINENGTGDFDFETNDGRFSYDAEFCLYDIASRKIVDGIKSYEDSFKSSGLFINYVDESGNERTVNVNGVEAPEDARFLPMMSSGSGERETGYYKIVKDNIGKVYNENHQVVYTFNTDRKKGYGYEPIFRENGYFLAEHSYDTATTHYGDYAVLDDNFTPVTADVTLANSYSTTVGQYNKLFSLQNKLYDVKGNVVYEAKTSLTCKVANDSRDEVDYFLFNDGEVSVLVNQDAEIIYQATVEEETDFDHKACAAFKRSGDALYYYCFKDGDFTVKVNGNSAIGRHLVAVEEEDGTKSVVDLRTGEKVFTGYRNYYGQTIDSATYIMAVYDDDKSDLFMTVE